MKVCVLKPIRHDQLGALKPGAVRDMPEPWATKYLKMGAVERVETKLPDPLAEAGEGSRSSALPADQASAPKTSPRSKRGAKRRKKAGPS